MATANTNAHRSLAVLALPKRINLLITYADNVVTRGGRRCLRLVGAQSTARAYISVLGRLTSRRSPTTLASPAHATAVGAAQRDLRHGSCAERHFMSV